jgi:hypothetical protein
VRELIFAPCDTHAVPYPSGEYIIDSRSSNNNLCKNAPFFIYLEEFIKERKIADRLDDIAKESVEKMIEIYWGFITHGFIVPIPVYKDIGGSYDKYHYPRNDSENSYDARPVYSSFDHMMVTVKGKNLFEQKKISPLCFDSFINELSKSFEDVFDNEIIVHLGSAINLFKYNFILESMMFLGITCELIFKKMIQLFCDQCLSQTAQIQYEKDFKKDSFSIDKWIRKLLSILDNNKEKLSKYSKNHYPQWIRFFDEIRNDRNDVGHGIIKEFKSDIVYGYLLQLRHVLREIKSNLFKDLEANKI